ncbi:uncharacterized protein LOC131930702 [Physella acuta]|uniref:uncharacterized protein LOC131930702 n=1 Tax=Physella acuta TaxID=109671 RepID=UPI0027DDD156|nr:uncharacterized protein LOC131930702 [Physella acuta]XP_059143269.1 uncharacterized protein LOC131930702 [Physella acuta]
MYFFLSIILLVVSTCMAFQPGEVREVTGLNGSCPIVKFAVEAINKKLGVIRTFCNVSSAYVQTVEGEKWYLDLVLTAPGKKVDLCHVEVWSRPWLIASEALVTTRDPFCVDDASHAKPVVVNINSTEVQKALSFAECKLNNNSDCPVLWKAVSIGQVTSQFLSGTYYNFTDVVWSPTNCSKKTTHSLTPGCVPTKDVTCPACHFGVWEAWMQPMFKLNNNNCTLKPHLLSK